MKHLYVTDWAPNGTNDLLVVEHGEIVAVVESATFGIDVGKPRSVHPLVADNTVVYRLASPDCFRSDIHTFVKRISRAELKRHMCVSPVDPDGTELRRRLRQAGVNLRGVK